MDTDNQQGYPKIRSCKAAPGDYSVGLRTEIWSGSSAYTAQLCIYGASAKLVRQIRALTILCKVIKVAWQSPLDPPGTRKQEVLEVCEMLFLLFFTFEMAIKMVAYGLVVALASTQPPLCARHSALARRDASRPARGRRTEAPTCATRGASSTFSW